MRILTILLLASLAPALQAGDPETPDRIEGLRVVTALEDAFLYRKAPDPASPARKTPAASRPAPEPLHEWTSVERGDLIWTGTKGRVSLLIEGHTLLQATPGTLFAVPPPSVQEKDPALRVDVIQVFAGLVKINTDWRYVPDGTRIKGFAGKKVGSMEFGPVVLGGRPAAAREGAAGDSFPYSASDLRRAMKVAGATPAFTRALYTPVPPDWLLRQMREKLTRAEKKPRAARPGE